MPCKPKLTNALVFNAHPIAGMKRNALNTNALCCTLSALHGPIFRRTANLFSANYGKPLKEFPVKVPVVQVNCRNILRFDSQLLQNRRNILRRNTLRFR